MSPDSSFDLTDGARIGVAFHGPNWQTRQLKDWRSLTDFSAKVAASS